MIVIPIGADTQLSLDFGPEAQAAPNGVQPGSNVIAFSARKSDETAASVPERDKIKEYILREADKLTW